MVEITDKYRPAASGMLDGSEWIPSNRFGRSDGFENRDGTFTAKPKHALWS